ncbi:NAD(P)H-dependent glycerol-3-phosphate dehydrogenase [Thiomicrorhabdus sp. 6S3-12]|uniref:NAD(P)H-dependent glycerol-3-phosphate dehydrogenase n=1 Tax=Thiomicrorhabdus sp. 6S3-12 TaxID=2819681 RepID=UPI001AAD2892|nr:NAD(P)H-dependent glycerol-3-phosphate dehydrogenase [Thiomicrorhabdus sp. 6S3-12]MBO1924777.1 NAD(P)-dependent glycerol-3-phosphate dehydrogenase [Thiomicrorhabdus sp. 6S3-12]
MSKKIAVLGAGAWGTALAIHLSRVGHEVVLWTHNAKAAKEMRTERQNRRYLKDSRFPDGLMVSDDLKASVSGVDGILVVVPSHVFRDVLRQLAGILDGARPHIAWATKGFEPDSLLLLHKVAQQVLGAELDMTVLSGPTFAAEVAKGLPTAMVSASQNSDEADFWAQAFHHANFRIYTQNDIVGVEVGGAYKNIMAIATGVSDGLGLGANARAALISRGMAEMMRLSLALGGSGETMMGLAGLGDLVLTCTDDLSRNRRFGYQLAKPGAKVDEVIEKIGQVVEGVKAVRAVHQLAEKLDLDLPIMQEVFALVEGKETPEQAARALLARDGKAEIE